MLAEQIELLLANDFELRLVPVRVDGEKFADVAIVMEPTTPGGTAKVFQARYPLGPGRSFFTQMLESGLSQFLRGIFTPAKSDGKTP